MTKIKHVPVDKTQIFDMRRTRGYISVRNKEMKFYHKFRDEESYIRWLKTEEIEFAWGETIWDILRM